MENEVLKAIKERRSIRRFKKEQVSDAEQNTVLEAGTWAPTGMGTQDPFIVAVQDERQKAILSGINAEIMGAKSDPSMARQRKCMSSRLLATPTT